MVKVITITSHTHLVEKGQQFVETEYPKLNKYLEEGYYIQNTIPIIKPADQSYMYAITFILNK